MSFFLVDSTHFSFNQFYGDYQVELVYQLSTNEDLLILRPYEEENMYLRKINTKY